MKLALYTRKVDIKQKDIYERIFTILNSSKISFIVNPAFYKNPFTKTFINNEKNVFKTHKDVMKHKVDFFLTIGGDGTFLDALLFVMDSEIPVLGINAGSLGFLSNNPQESIEKVIENLLKMNFELEDRSVIKLVSNKPIFENENYALNDFTIHKRDNSSLTAISTYLNNEFFNTYWGDGIIVATPTGSTAYSLSCGGPIVYPFSKNFILTPVAPHNLNVRSVVISDDMDISFEIKARDRNFMISLDSRYKIINSSYKLKISKAPFLMKSIRFKERDFSKIIREKLMWGIDNRNKYFNRF